MEKKYCRRDNFQEKVLPRIRTQSKFQFNFPYFQDWNEVLKKGVMLLLLLQNYSLFRSHSHWNFFFSTL
jgi:hypothetical protein